MDRLLCDNPGKMASKLLTYQVDQRVEAVVERILPFGVFARLDDGTAAYIRRRELDLDADADPGQVVQIGRRIAAIVIDLEAGKHIELSRRLTLADPWLAFSQQSAVGDTLRGSVRALAPVGAFIRVSPGVDGFIPLAELATWEVGRPEELLWVGDRVEAVISYCSLASKRLTLSIKSRLEQRNRVLGVLEHITGQPAEKSGRAPGRSVVIDPPARPVVFKDAGKILVVDDHAGIRRTLAAWLARRGFEVQQAASLAEARQLMQQNGYRFLLLDLNLPDGDGLELVHLSRRHGADPHVCLMSTPVSLAERANELHAAGVSQVFPKPLNMAEFESCLAHLARGERFSRPRQGFAPSNSEIPGFGELAAFKDTQVALHERLQQILNELTATVRAQDGLLFYMDPGSGAITILIHSGEGVLNEAALYSLRDSPVKDVISEEAPVLENHVLEKAAGRFHKLLELLMFESCMGVPVPVQGEFHHAAFFFQPQVDAFSRYRLRDAQAGAMLLSALLEEELFHRQIQVMSPLLLTGQLASGFGHEVFNKISSLELQVLNLLAEQDNLAELQAGLVHLQESASDLKNTVEGFQQLMFSPEAQVECDVNAILQRARRLIQPLANKEHTRILFTLAPDLPAVFGNHIALQQVFLNLMLNAVQQMAILVRKSHAEGRRLLEVRTEPDDSGAGLLIRFVDTGPGIHRQLWEKIFTPGFSTRGGSGLGLYIARSFTQALGGSIQVEDSLIPLGTTFLVSLPVRKPPSSSGSIASHCKQPAI